MKEKTKRVPYFKLFSDGPESQSGQGVIEYILILVVTVALFIGLLTQFNKSVQVWLNNYFGEYLACLLETGELPSIGSGEGGGICAQFYSPFRAELTPPNRDGSRGSGGSSGAGGRSGSRDRESAADRAASRGGIESNRSGRSGGGSFTPISGYRPSSSRGPSRSFGASNAGGETNTGSTAVSTPAGLMVSSSDGGTFRVPPQQVNRAFSTARTREEEREKTKIPANQVQSDAASQTPKRFPASTKLKKSDLPDIGDDWSFGDYFRYLLIAAIIIAIIVFFGGQVLQMSKSMD